MFWALYDAVQVMTVAGIVLTDNKHGQPFAEAFEPYSKDPGVQLVGKVTEVLLRPQIIKPFTINTLLLSKRDVHRVWHPVLEVVSFYVLGFGHGEING